MEKRLEEKNGENRWRRAKTDQGRRLESGGEEWREQMEESKDRSKRGR